jgi:hypothetical protein
MSGVDPLAILGIGSIGVASYQLFVTVRLIKFAGYSVGQKVAQSFVIWLLPLLGAWIVHAVIRMTEKAIAKADRDFTPQGPQSVS